MAQAISTDFPYESRFIAVHDSEMHYIDVGEGDPILFLHGNPTSAYLWRNIIPHVKNHGRCIAVDLIGMGKSGKPDIDYRFFDHVKYLDEFIAALDLKNVTLVVHDWGSALGFHYAMRHPENVKGIVFMEAIIRPFSYARVQLPFRLMFQAFRAPGLGWLLISVLNMFVNVVLPGSVVRPMTSAEMAHYRAPYPTVASRKPVHQWPREVPFDEEPYDVHQAVQAYSEKLQESQLPKLLFYATPGALITPNMVKWCEATLPNLTTVDVGEGRHFIQEDHPHLIGEELAKWVEAL